MPPEDTFRSQDNDEPPPRPSRARLYWFIGGFLLLFLGMAAVAIYTDAPPPDVSDLAFEPVVVADEENLYLALVKRAEALKTAPIIRDDEPDDPPPPVPEGEVAQEESGGSYNPDKPTLREKLLKGESWTPERIARWGPALDQLVEECREIMKLEKAQAGMPTSLEDIVPVGAFREFATQLSLAAWARFSTGRQMEAVDASLLSLEMGQRLVNARGVLIDYLVGLAVQSISRRTLQSLAAHADINSDALRHLLMGLHKTPNGADEITHVMRNEFRWMHLCLANLEPKHVANVKMEFDFLAVVAKTRVLFPFVYKPNQTVGLYAETVRAHLRSHDLPLATRKALPPPASEEWLGPREFLRPANLQGRVLLQMISPSYQSFFTNRQMGFSQHSALTVFVALRLYHREHDALPATLDELVPEYLPAVPLDYIDRMPIRYSRDFRVVWSVGRNNLQVTAVDQKIEERETFYRLDFAAPPVAATAESVATEAPGTNGGR